MVLFTGLSTCEYPFSQTGGEDPIKEKEKTRPCRTVPCLSFLNPYLILLRLILDVPRHNVFYDEGPVTLGRQSNLGVNDSSI